jgi:pyrroloquinoline quinone biosynthesis protein B
LHPRQGARDTPIAGVLLTNGDVDHIAGLLTLRERQSFILFAVPAILDMIDRNEIFGVLDAGRVSRQPIEIGRPLEVLPCLVVTDFLLPGKVPLFLEDGEIETGTLSDMTIGLEITCGERRLIYAPACASIPADLVRRLAGADAILFDGTTFTDDEMPRLGLAEKTAARMGHVAISGCEGSLARLAGLAAGRKIFIHINNSNPILIEGSPERQTAEAAGWEIAYDGMEIAL